MHLEIKQSSLAQALFNVSGVVERRNTIPILCNVKIEVIDNLLKLTTTDMDIMVTSQVEVNNLKENGSTTVASQLLYDIIKKIPNETQIRLIKNNSCLRIEYNKSKFSLPVLNSNEFPTLSEEEPISTFKIKSYDFAKIIDKTEFAISNDETRYYLNGIFLCVKEKDNKQLISVATDGHKLSFMSSRIDSFTGNLEGVIVPKKTVSTIRKIITDQNSVSIAVSKTKIKVICDNSIVTSKLIDGKFPEYEKIIPNDNNKTLIVSKEELSRSIDIVSTMSSDKHRSIKFLLQKNKIILQAYTQDGGFANDEIDVDFTEEPLEIGFNSNYLAQIIKKVETDKITMHFKSNSCPILIDSKYSSHNSGLYLIMPIRT